MLKREISFFPAHSVIWTAQSSNDHQVDSGIFVHCWRIVLCLKADGHWLPGHVHLFWVWYVQMLYAVHRVTCMWRGYVSMSACGRWVWSYLLITSVVKISVKHQLLAFLLSAPEWKKLASTRPFFLLLSFQILVFWHATSIFLLTCKDSCIYSHLGLSKHWNLVFGAKNLLRNEFLLGSSTSFLLIHNSI